MKRIVLQILALFLSIGAFAVGAADLVDDEAAKKVLAKKCIRLGTTEVLPVEFETARAVLESHDLFAAAQTEFAKTLAEGEEIDSPIVEEAPGKYHYSDKRGRKTHIYELYRKQTDDHSLDYIVHARGDRFFGGYDVIIHLRIIDAADRGVVYCVHTHAYPHNWITRFSARDIGVTKRYFKKNMKSLSWLAREIGMSLCEAQEFRDKLNAETESD